MGKKYILEFVNKTFERRKRKIGVTKTNKKVTNGKKTKDIRPSS